MHRHILLLVIVFLQVLPLNAYNLRVIAVKDESEEKVEGLLFEAFHTNYEKIGDAISLSDSTYLFQNLPNDTVLVSATLSTIVIDKLIPHPQDSLVILIPEFQISKSLSEVLVMSERQFIDGDKTTFFPNLNEKKISAGAIALLQNMAIPSIDVSPVDYSIKTIDGEGFATFIDFLPASLNDMKNLRTVDVSKIEIYEYPKDPRFNGARHAINIVLKKYEYGGYTLLSGNQGLVDNRGIYNLATKFTYKKMTYDVAVDLGYNRNKHTGMHSVAKYTFPEGDVHRSEFTDEGFAQNRSLSTIFRAVYQTEKSVISNTIGFNRESQPDCYRVDITDFSSDLYLSGLSNTNTESRNFSPFWNGSCQFFLPNGYSLVISPSASLGKFFQKYCYQSNNVLIENNVDEKAWDVSTDLTLQKNINKQSISLAIFGVGQHNDLKYTGTTPSNVVTKYYACGGRLSANLRLNKWWAQGNVGLYYNHTSINSIRKDEIAPKYFIAAGYNFNNKNNISISSEMSYWSIPLSQQGDNVQHLNQIDAIEGNPDLKTYLYNSVKLRYQWLPKNHLLFSFYGGFYRFSNPVSVVYDAITATQTPIMVRRYVNSGFFNNWNYGGAATLKLLNNSLVFQLKLAGESVSSHCAEHVYRDNILKFGFSVLYSTSGFWTQLLYNSEDKYISSISQSKTPPFYQIGFGWGNGNINLSAKVINLFNSSWVGDETSIFANNYNYMSTTYTSHYHRAFEISVTYSFSYGKKVNYSASMNRNSVNSAILY